MASVRWHLWTRAGSAPPVALSDGLSPDSEGPGWAPGRGVMSSPRLPRSLCPAVPNSHLPLLSQTRCPHPGQCCPSLPREPQARALEPVSPRALVRRTDSGMRLQGLCLVVGSTGTTRPASPTPSEPSSVHDACWVTVACCSRSTLEKTPWAGRWKKCA